MGLLDSLLGPILGAVGAGGPAAGPVPAAAGVLAGVTGGILGPVAGILDPVLGIVGGVAEIPGQLVETVTGTVSGITGAVLGGGAAGRAIDTTGFSRGNGFTATRTIVETMNIQTGQIVRTRSMPGTPFLMNSEVQAAKRVFKKSADLRKRIPRKTVRQSATEQLKEAALDAAIRASQSSGSKD